MKDKVNKVLNKDVKELNGIIVSLFSILFLVGVGFISYKISNSYALFGDSITGSNTIGVEASLGNLDKSGANEPILDTNMIAVYYDEISEVWKKADSTNMEKDYQWYDYSNKMWANSVTVTDFKTNSNTIAYQANPQQTLQYYQEGLGFDTTWYYSFDEPQISNGYFSLNGDILENKYDDFGSVVMDDILTEGNGNFYLASTNNEITDYYRIYKSGNMVDIDNVTIIDTGRRNYYQNASPGTEIAMDDILTMQVWVPRYKYKVWNYNSDGTKTSEAQEIEIVFEKDTNTTGEIECTDTISGTNGAKSESCKINNVECTDSTCNNKYYTHPAFTFGEEEIEGFWIGKFELTGTIDSITTKPNLTSLSNQTVSSFATNIMAMNDSGNQYGFNTSTDTHMIKNMEWGAVAYLSHSKYGVNREVYINNSSSRYTGRSGGNVGGSTPINGTYTDQTSTTQYNSYGFYTYDGYLLEYGTNTKSSTKDLSKVASTTGNIYGVYDMSGGAYDYVMGNIVSSDGTTMIAGSSGFTTYPDTKYYDKYSYGRSTSQRIRSKLGDGIKEVLNTSSRSWYSDSSYLADSNYPWFNRSGSYYIGSYAGAFNSYYNLGYAHAYYSSRLVITP